MFIFPHNCIDCVYVSGISMNDRQINHCSRWIVGIRFICFQNINSVNNSKYLGITINNRFTWQDHINSTATKASKVFAFLRRNLHDCSIKVRSASCTIMVRPILKYSAAVWDPYLEKRLLCPSCLWNREVDHRSEKLHFYHTMLVGLHTEVKNYTFTISCW